MKKNKAICFDLDGVIINSLPNMQKSWEETCKKNNLYISFLKYKKLIGLPFKEILKKLNIKNKFNIIQSDYRNFSNQNLKLIKCYPDIKKILKKLSKKNKIVIITSKERNRSIKILKLKNINYDLLVTPSDVKKGKPHPESIKKVLEKFSLNRKNILFIGDTVFDYMFAKNSKVDFLFANWGYGSINYKNLKRLNKPVQLLKYI